MLCTAVHYEPLPYVLHLCCQQWRRWAIQSICLNASLSQVYWLCIKILSSSVMCAWIDQTLQAFPAFSTSARLVHRWMLWQSWGIRYTRTCWSVGQTDRRLLFQHYGIATVRLSNSDQRNTSHGYQVKLHCHNADKHSLLHQSPNNLSRCLWVRGEWGSEEVAKFWSTILVTRQGTAHPSLNLQVLSMLVEDNERICKS